MRVLVVDDNEIFLRNLTVALVALGKDCDMAADGDAAMRLMDVRSYDVIVTDLVMPARGGLTLANYASYRAPDVPVVLMTGSAHGAYGELVGQTNNTAMLLRKPFRTEDLNAVLDYLYARRGPRLAASTHSLPRGASCASLPG
ncbi:MAG: response regulator [Pseudomonadota bacterium]